jgi:hypothetical protein
MSAPNTCHWCGKKIRWVCHTEWENAGFRPPPKCYGGCRTDSYEPAPKPSGWTLMPGAARAGEPDVYRCNDCGDHRFGERKRRIKSRHRLYNKPGPGGNGYFCSNNCAAAWGRAAVRKGCTCPLR